MLGGFMYINPINPYEYSNQGSQDPAHGLNQESINEIKNIETTLQTIVQKIHNNPSESDFREFESQIINMKTSITSIEDQFPSAFAGSPQDPIQDLDIVQSNIHALSRMHGPGSKSPRERTTENINAVIRSYNNFLDNLPYET